MTKIIDKNTTLGILNDWNFWHKEQEIGLAREKYLKRIEEFSSANQILVITGARRAGKSFIMRQFAKKLIKQGHKTEQILIINFEDPRWPQLNAKLLQEVYELYLENLNPVQKPFIFLDEVQEVQQWEKWANMMHELKKANVIVSGSNAKLLSQELATLLTGRHLDITVFPLSFKEFLSFQDIKTQDKLDIVNQRINIKRLLKEYLEFGGFPEVVLNKPKKKILLNYLDDIFNKDLVRRYKIRKTEKLKSLIRFYLSNISNLTTFNSLAKSLNLTSDAIEKFSGYLETAYVLFFLKRFSFKVKEQEKSPRKVYAVDTGLPNAAGFKFSQNIGKTAENLVFLELKRQCSENQNLEIYYWKDERHREVDFIVKEKNDLKQLIQVCWDISEPETKKREIRSLLKASDELKCNNLLVITKDYEREEGIKTKKIKFLPLWQWLLK